MEGISRTDGGLLRKRDFAIVMLAMKEEIGWSALGTPPEILTKMPVARREEEDDLAERDISGALFCDTITQTLKTRFE
ncbi:hypothetical protein NDU88_001139 [Pleurodeles waltl]|uniref:Uncharacterized protein n=1 Tax=Pleurodeles waltl TaxID=8319 RepID=A0AAV7S849_PLEWA|nr:hypothetical protein NDU88_001139 [Pleurodeles waltl]